MVSIKTIQSFVKSSGVKSILQTKALKLQKSIFKDIKLSKFGVDDFDAFIKQAKNGMFPDLKSRNINTIEHELRNLIFKNSKGKVDLYKVNSELGFRNALIDYTGAFPQLRGANRVKMNAKTFNSYDEAFEYSKKKIMAPLHSKNPYEYMTIIDSKTNTVISEFKGTARNVFEDKLNIIRLKETKAKALHGHPGNPPVSYGDLGYINNKANLDEIVAFNPQGEFSLIRKTKKYKELSSSELTSLNLQSAMNVLKTIKPNSPAANMIKQNDELKGFFQLSQKRKLSTNEKKRFIELLDDPIFEQAKTIEGSRAIHNTWKSIAEKLGLKYETNYSYLT